MRSAEGGSESQGSLPVAESMENEADDSRLPKRRGLWIALGAAAVLIITFGVFLAIGAYDRSRYAETDWNTVDIARAVTHCRMANDRIPMLGELVGDGGYLEYYFNILPMNPYSGQPVKLVGSGDEATWGDFSYFVLMANGKPVQYIVVTYTPAASVAEVVWSKLVWELNPSARADWCGPIGERWGPELASTTEPGLVWIAGCGCDPHICVARGLSRQQVLDELEDSKYWLAGCNSELVTVEVLDPPT